MVSIIKINSKKNQAKRNGEGYLFYLNSPSTRQRGDFDEYARSNENVGPAPFWVGDGAAVLGLDTEASPEHVERLASGFHPLTAEALVRGAGDDHVMGLDLTFSPPKDFSAVYAGADDQTREELLACLHGSVKAALAYAEDGALTRHGAAGHQKQVAEATLTVCYTHFASRSLDPQIHVHSFMFNLGKRSNTNEWSALEQRPLFDRKMAIGALFRVELAARLRGLGFGVVPDGSFFQIAGITEDQREALSTRSREITERVKEMRLGASETGAGTGTGSRVSDAALRAVAALNTRAAKSEPPLPELLDLFSRKAATLGLTPERVKAMRAPFPAPVGTREEIAIDQVALLATLMKPQSIATPQQALTAICEQAMAIGSMNAEDCLAELQRLMKSENVVQLGLAENLTPVFASRLRVRLEAEISKHVREGTKNFQHRISADNIKRRFAELAAELQHRLGVDVSLEQQCEAAIHIGCQTGTHAFVEGWAGTGKTTLLKVVNAAYVDAGMSVLGVCQSAAAARNLGQETGISSRTIASFLLAVEKGRVKLSSQSVLVLDEAGMVGSQEFASLQAATVAAGAKLICVGDAKQLQPIDGGGIFRSLMAEYGKAELSNIQRQRTDFGPLLEWLDTQALLGTGGLTPDKTKAFREVPEQSQMQALKNWCAGDAKLALAFDRWRARFDYEWLRQSVRLMANGDARTALQQLDDRGHLQLLATAEAAAMAAVDAWTRDKTPLPEKIMIAGTRTEVAELNRLARERLIDQGVIDDALGVDIETKTRDGNLALRRFSPGDRIVFTKNDRDLGVNNGTTGTVLSVEFAAPSPIEPHLLPWAAEETLPEQNPRRAASHDREASSSAPSTTLVV